MGVNCKALTAYPLTMICLGDYYHHMVSRRLALLTQAPAKTLKLSGHGVLDRTNVPIYS